MPSGNVFIIDLRCQNFLTSAAKVHQTRPHNVVAWLTMTEGSTCTDVYFLDAKHIGSRSNVTREQFAALRVLRRNVDFVEMKAKHFEDLGIPDLGPARDLLDANPLWKLFPDVMLDLEQHATAALGIVGAAIKNQRMACGRVGVTAPTFTMALRPRPPPQAVVDDDEDDDEDEDDDDDDDDDGEDDDDDSGDEHHEDEAGVDDDNDNNNLAAGRYGDDSRDDDNDLAEGDEGDVVAESEVHPYAPPPATPKRAGKHVAGKKAVSPQTPASKDILGPLAFPRTDDEMVINMALIVTAQALTQLAHDARLLHPHIDWTMQRAALRVFRGDAKLYEAQVDGHLSQQTNTGPGEPKMSVEVKAERRSTADGVYYQEAAQFAAWIAAGRADRRLTEIKWSKDGRYR